MFSNISFKIMILAKDVFHTRHVLGEKKKVFYFVKMFLHFQDFISFS